MRLFVASLISGISVGMVYAVVGLVVCIVYRTSRILNLAEGQLFVAGGLGAAVWIGNGHSSLSVVEVIEIILVGGAVGCVAGIALRYLLRPVEKVADDLEVVVASFGALYVLQGISGIIWGVNPQNLPNFPGSGPIRITEGVGIPAQTWYVLGVFLFTYTLTRMLFGKNGVGVRFRASGYQPKVLQLHGIRTHWVVLVSYIITGVVAGVAGALFVPLTTVSYSGGTSLALYGVIAAVAGGLERPAGAVIAGLSLGIAESLGQAYTGGLFGDAVALGALVVVLVIRPSGMLVPKETVALR